MVGAFFSKERSCRSKKRRNQVPLATMFPLDH